jgi:1,5-anhydro-D-fructose reductase (1,5-anhydro-D-mannitol-forming)
MVDVKQGRDVKWLVVGTSDINKKRAVPAMVAARNSRVVGVVGGLERARALADAHGVVHAYDNLDVALKESGADAVYIGTPVYRHRPEAQKAFDAGKHVLIEKPLGLSGDDAQAIADGASKAGVIAGCAYYRRFFPRYELARQMIRDGVFGTITGVRIHVSSWFNPEASDPKIWRTKKALAGGGNGVDMGCHMLDLLVHLLGQPESVQAITGTLVQRYEVDDSVAAVMRLPGGAPVLADFHWNTQNGGHEFEIIGSHARLRLVPADTGPVVKTVNKETVTLEMPNSANVHVPLIQDFVDSVLAGRQPYIPLDGAVKVNRLIDAIYRSGTSGKTEKV